MESVVKDGAAELETDAGTIEVVIDDGSGVEATGAELLPIVRTTLPFMI